MDAVSLKSRAVTFSIGAGAVVFILALAATSGGRLDAAGRALIAAIVCAAMCWAYAEHAVAGTAAALDAAIDRLASASRGDLESPIPPTVGEHVPQLSAAMEGLFGQMHRQLDTVQRLALFDAVTGLPNRTNFRHTVEGALAQLTDDAAAAVLFIDLDRFKHVNDTMGHASGDALLAMVADRLRAVVAGVVGPEGPAPLIGRLAGDEFTIFIPAATQLGTADGIARGVLAALGEPFDVADQQVSIGASVGVAQRPEHGRTLTDLMRAADAAMYHAKAGGRGRAERFSDGLAAQIADRAQLEADLRTAIDDDDFALVFQPQIALSDDRIVGAEALLRWHHSSGDVRLPGSFLTRAEESGLIVEIGDWVVAAVAATIRRWSRAGVEQRLAVNISQRQIDHALFFRRLRDALHAAGAPARLLELEISETLAMHCSDEVIAAIAALRADGATIAIDDFGTGYSNLPRLRDLPVDRVKLDPSLVENIATCPGARAVVQSVVGLIHGMGYEAVGEGVESAAQIAVLRVIGCDVVQGYAVAAPMPEAAFLDWARAERRRLRA
ncbi:putative bifunctional diguanylate cyclase/phosphodiesterase [Sphingomonas sp. RS2018]